MAMDREESWSIRCDRHGCTVFEKMFGEPYWFGAVDLWLKEHPGWTVSPEGWLCPYHPQGVTEFGPEANPTPGTFVPMVEVSGEGQSVFLKLAAGSYKLRQYNGCAQLEAMSLP